MLRLNRETKAFAQLPQRKLSEAGILERHDHQAMIAASPEAFFAELREENIRFLAQEIRPDDLVDDRIDLLGADENGAAVIIELKRGHHRMHLLQALSYAGMLSKLDSARFIERVAQFADKSASEIEETLDEFVEGLSAAINKSQRIVLIAEDFDYSVLITAEWLYEKYNVDVRCYRLRLSGDQAAEFLTCERVSSGRIDQTSNPGSRAANRGEIRYKNWDEALAGVANKDIVDFFKQELANGRRGYLTRRVLNWYQDGRRRFWVVARKNYAVGGQIGRFDGDVEFWRSKLGGADDDVGVLGRHNNRVRFRLRTAEQISEFCDAIDGPLAARRFLSTAIAGDEDESEADAEE